MYEKVNPCHPDKVADRIAGALVDLSYAKQNDPRVAVEVLIGHGTCHIISETSCHIELDEVKNVVERIAGKLVVDYLEVKQDEHLSNNQSEKLRCGDNGIFKGTVVTNEQHKLCEISEFIYSKYPTDGKYIITDNKAIICQSNAKNKDLKKELAKYGLELTINPLGEWTGGTNVDSGATNRKLGSDMGDSVTGGGLHGKDLSKADVSVNIYAWIKAQKENKTVELNCAIGDDKIDGMEYSKIVDIAREFIKNLGGFEKFAEWGILR